jgi:hypothetical protein
MKEPMEFMLVRFFPMVGFSFWGGSVVKGGRGREGGGTRRHMSRPGRRGENSILLVISYKDFSSSSNN